MTYIPTLKRRALDAAEIAAVRRFCVAAGQFYFWGQPEGAHALENFAPYEQFVRDGHAPALLRAADAYETTQPGTLYAGFGNAAEALGDLLIGADERMLGAPWRRAGVTIATDGENLAELFITRSHAFSAGPALLEFQLPAATRLLPTGEVGGDFSTVVQNLIPAATPFTVVATARRVVQQRENVLHLTLAPA